MADSDAEWTHLSSRGAASLSVGGSARFPCTSLTDARISLEQAEPGVGEGGRGGGRDDGAADMVIKHGDVGQLGSGSGESAGGSRGRGSRGSRGSRSSKGTADGSVRGDEGRKRQGGDVGRPQLRQSRGSMGTIEAATVSIGELRAEEQQDEAIATSISRGEDGHGDEGIVGGEGERLNGGSAPRQSMGGFGRLSIPRSSVGSGGGATVLSPAPDIITVTNAAGRGHQGSHGGSSDGGSGGVLYPLDNGGGGGGARMGPGGMGSGVSDVTAAVRWDHAPLPAPPPRVARTSSTGGMGTQQVPVGRASQGSFVEGGATTAATAAAAADGGRGPSLRAVRPSVGAMGTGSVSGMHGVGGHSSGQRETATDTYGFAHGYGYGYGTAGTVLLGADSGTGGGTSGRKSLGRTSISRASAARMSRGSEPGHLSSVARSSMTSTAEAVRSSVGSAATVPGTAARRFSVGMSRARSGRDSAGGASIARLTQGEGLVRPKLAAPTYVTRGADTKHLL